MFSSSLSVPCAERLRTEVLPNPANYLNVSSDLREPEQVTLPADTRSRHTTYELALLSMVL